MLGTWEQRCEMTKRIILAAVSRTIYRGLRTWNDLCPLKHSSSWIDTPSPREERESWDPGNQSRRGHQCSVHALMGRWATRGPLNPASPGGRGAGCEVRPEPRLAEGREAATLRSRNSLSGIDLEGDAEDLAAPRAGPPGPFRPALSSSGYRHRPSPQK